MVKVLVFVLIDLGFLSACLDKEVGPHQEGKNTEESIIVGIKEGGHGPMLRIRIPHNIVQGETMTSNKDLVVIDSIEASSDTAQANDIEHFYQ